MSFDFFDTLMTRNSASPDAVQHFVGFTLGSEASADFFRHRKAAEAAVWQQHPDIGDVTLEEIYAVFRSEGSWSDDGTSLAAEREAEVDAGFLLPRENVIALLRQARVQGKRTIIISDSFYPRDFFTDVLRRYGLLGLVDAFYISSEQRARKGHGALWRRVVEAEGLRQRRCVHFGDHPDADVDMAHRFGLRAALLPNPAPLLWERGLAYRPGTEWEADILLGPLFARFGNDPFASSPLVLRRAEDFGHFVYGPVLLAFFSWLVRNPALHSIGTLCFTSREGFLLQRYYQAMTEMLGQRTLPQSVYLPISRQAVLAASQAVAFDPALVLDAGGYAGTLAGLLKSRLGFRFSDEHISKACYRLPEDRVPLTAMLETLSPLLMSAAAAQLHVMRDYFATALGSPKDWALVDVGYSGTIQRCLQRVLSAPLRGFYMATNGRISQVRETGGVAYGCFRDGLYEPVPDDGFFRKTVLLEALLTAPHGQLLRFERGPDGVPRPCFGPGQHDSDGFRVLEQIFAGALSYAEDALGSGGHAILPVCVRARAHAFHGLDAVLGGRISVSAQLARSLFLEDEFSGNGNVRAVPPSLTRAA